MSSLKLLLKPYELNLNLKCLVKHNKKMVETIKINFIVMISVISNLRRSHSDDKLLPMHDALVFRWLLRMLPVFSLYHKNGQCIGLVSSRTSAIVGVECG